MNYTAILQASDASRSAAPNANGLAFGGDIRFSAPDIGSRNDAQAVQSPPRTVPVKHYVVIDAAQRNWVTQPNPYSNLVYSFGSQSPAAYSPPVYANNSFVPTFAANSNGILNAQPGLPNTQGWYLPQGTSNIFYPPYNSSVPAGNFIGYDSGYNVKPSGLGFGSVFTASNVASIRLIRALLPQRQFLNIPVLVTTSNAYSNQIQYQYDISNYGATGVLQTNLGNTPYSAFSTYPYLLFYVNEYTGKYVSGNEAMRRAFSVMTQRTRTQTDFAIGIGVQHYDYEPWGSEALVFQSPITNLQQLKISVTDPNGLQFTQNDALSITLIQTDSNQLFLKCITGTNQFFNDNELRVGDRVIFDPVSLSNILKSSLISQYSGKVSFVNALSNASFPVLQLLDCVYDSTTGNWVPRTSATPRTASYDTSYNAFLIPNFLISSGTGDVSPLYPTAVDPGNFQILSFPIQYNTNPIQTVSNLPFLNTSLQPTYTLELTCLEPDTGALGGMITQ